MPESNPFRSETTLSPWWRQPALVYTVLVLGVVVAVGFLSKWSDTGHHYSKPFVRKLKYLIEQSTRWNAMAQQDTNPILQMIHCNYALAYAQVARSVTSDRDIENVAGIDINELIYYLGECEAYAIKNLGQQCPTIKVEGVYSLGSGWT